MVMLCALAFGLVQFPSSFFGVWVTGADSPFVITGGHSIRFWHQGQLYRSSRVKSAPSGILSGLFLSEWGRSNGEIRIGYGPQSSNGTIYSLNADISVSGATMPQRIVARYVGPIEILSMTGLYRNGLDKLDVSNGPGSLGRSGPTNLKANLTVSGATYRLSGLRDNIFCKATALDWASGKPAGAVALIWHPNPERVEAIMDGKSQETNRVRVVGITGPLKGIDADFSK